MVTSSQAPACTRSDFIAGAPSTSTSPAADQLGGPGAGEPEQPGQGRVEPLAGQPVGHGQGTAVAGHGPSLPDPGMVQSLVSPLSRLPTAQ